MRPRPSPNISKAQFCLDPGVCRGLVGSRDFDLALILSANESRLCPGHTGRAPERRRCVWDVLRGGPAACRANATQQEETLALRGCYTVRWFSPSSELPLEGHGHLLSVEKPAIYPSLWSTAHRTSWESGVCASWW